MEKLNYLIITFGIYVLNKYLNIINFIIKGMIELMIFIPTY